MILVLDPKKRDFLVGQATPELVNAIRAQAPGVVVSACEIDGRWRPSFDSGSVFVTVSEIPSTDLCLRCAHPVDRGGAPINAVGYDPLGWGLERCDGGSCKRR